MRIWSIGHGARSLADFLALLAEDRIRTVADVRSFPGSRKHPRFGKEALGTALSGA